MSPSKAFTTVATKGTIWVTSNLRTPTTGNCDRIFTATISNSVSMVENSRPIPRAQNGNLFSCGWGLWCPSVAVQFDNSPSPGNSSPENFDRTRWQLRKWKLQLDRTLWQLFTPPQHLPKGHFRGKAHDNIGGTEPPSQLRGVTTSVLLATKRLQEN